MHIRDVFAVALISGLTVLAPAVLTAKSEVDEAVVPSQETAVETAKENEKSQTSKAKCQSKLAVIVTPEAVREHVEWLAAPERKGRSGKSAQETANYIRKHFVDLKIKPLFDEGEYFQTIRWTNKKEGVTFDVGRNVGGWIAGTDDKLKSQFVMITAHYDHLGVRDGKVYAGADDNASGTSMMLALARHFSKPKNRTKRSLVFVGFDLEENFLMGSRWFAAHPPWELKQVKLFITADMIGRSLGNLPLSNVFVMGSEHSPQIRPWLAAPHLPEGLEVSQLGVDLIGTRSDYGPFRDRDVPFVFFSTGEHPDYHSPRDIPDRINFKKAAHISSVIGGLAKAVADNKVTPVWQDKGDTGLEEVESLHRITTLLLDESSGVKLDGLKRFFVSQAHNTAKAILDRGQITPDERTWLMRSCQLLLLSVF